MGEPVRNRRPGVGDEAGGHRFVDSRHDAVFGQSGGPTQDARLELGPDDGRHGQHVVGLVGEPGEPAAHDVPDAFGDTEVLDGRGRHPAAAVLFHRPGFGQVAEDLTDEERVAFGLGVDGAGEGFVFAVEIVTGGLLDVADDGGGVEAGQRAPLHAGLAAKVGQQFGQRMTPVEFGVPIGPDDQQPERLWEAQKVAEQEQRGFGGPVKVVEDEEDGLIGGGRGQPGADGVEEPVPLGLRVRMKDGLEVGNPLPQLGHEPGQFSAVPPEPLLQLRRGCVVEEMAQPLDERLIGHAEILVAPSGQDGASFCVHPQGELGGQSRLAHPRLPRQQRHPPVSGRRLLP